MDRLTPERLEAILVEKLTWFTGTSDDFKLYFAKDDEKHLYIISAIRDAPQKDRERSFVFMQVRVVGDHIVIDEDVLWDKNLWEVLVKADVPREQIVLAYKGEQTPVSSES
jgi:hypothetical protein